MKLVTGQFYNLGCGGCVVEKWEGHTYRLHFNRKGDKPSCYWLLVRVSGVLGF